MSGVVGDIGIRFSVVRRIGVRIIAELLQHWRYLTHTGNDVIRKLPHPLCQSFHVHRFYHLVGGLLCPVDGK